MTPTSFADLNLAPTLLDAVRDLGFEQPTAIQNEAIPPILERKDVLAGAETGSGKTAAYLLPILHNLLEQRKKDVEKGIRGVHVYALILVPTRELGSQVNEQLRQLASRFYPPVIGKTVVGGADIRSQIRNLESSAEILVSTPARVLRLLENKAVRMNRLKTVVVDEVDRLTENRFRTELEKLLEQIPVQHQTLMFTATLPDSIRYLVRRVLDQPCIINLEASDKAVTEQVITVNRGRKPELLIHLLNKNDWDQVLTFCNAKKTCDRLARQLREQGIEAASLHGNIPQQQRAAIMRDFRAKKIRVLVGTDVAARGVDIPRLPCVISVEPPREPNDYIHRVGRTGRASSAGTAIALIAHHEYDHFRVIENRCGFRLPREVIAGFEPDAQAPPVTSSRKHPKKKQKKRKKR